MTIGHYRIPSTSALRAFEAAARHCNFSRAAAELHTSQSAVSRHIATLESRLDTSLFIRIKSRRLALTPQGEQFYRAVVSALDNIQISIDSISGIRLGDQLTIACTHEISHLYLLPRFDALQQRLGGDKTIRVMTYEYESMDARLDPGIDILLQYDIEGVAPEDRAEIVHEAVMPVISPELYRRYRDRLESAHANWGEMPLLELSKRNYGWATWEEWLRMNASPETRPRYQYFNNYIYLLDAAVAGKGVALGWRGLIERYLETGVLRDCGFDYTVFARAIHAVLTHGGKAKPLARHCLSCLAQA